MNGSLSPTEWVMCHCSTNAIGHWSLSAQDPWGHLVGNFVSHSCVTFVFLSLEILRVRGNDDFLLGVKLEISSNFSENVKDFCRFLCFLFLANWIVFISFGGVICMGNCCMCMQCTFSCRISVCFFTSSEICFIQINMPFYVRTCCSRFCTTDFLAKRCLNDNKAL